MSEIGDIVPGSITSAPPIGAVLERPTGELALLWRLYADLLDKQEKFAKEGIKQDEGPFEIYSNHFLPDVFTNHVRRFLPRQPSTRNQQSGGWRGPLD
jgi:hypothetical protein